MLLFYCSTTFHGSHFLPSLNSSAWLSRVSKTCPTLSLPSPSHAFPVQSLSTVPWLGMFLLPAFTQRHPSHPDAHPSPFKPCPSFSVHFLHEAFFDCPDFSITIPFHTWTMRTATRLYVILYAYLVSIMFWPLWVKSLSSFSVSSAETVE